MSEWLPIENAPMNGIDALVAAGACLSNIAFNLSQFDVIAADYRAQLSIAAKRWDEALAAHRSDVILCLPTADEPFRRVDCVIDDIGNSDRILVVSCPEVETRVMGLVDAMPNDLRHQGLAVAVHNDYRINGESHTFWLFTDKSGMSFKGEGKTDAEALNQVRASIAAHRSATK